MKVKHMPAAFRHSPLFVLRHSLEMLSHTFAGSTLRSVLGLETSGRSLPGTASAAARNRRPAPPDPAVRASQRASTRWRGGPRRVRNPDSSFFVSPGTCALSACPRPSAATRLTPVVT
jgi:hypothetical protein